MNVEPPDLQGLSMYRVPLRVTLPCLALSLIAAILPAQSPPIVVATLTGGKTVQGTLDHKTLKITTSYGYAVVKVQMLGSITFGKPDVVLTTDGSKLSGELTLSTFRLRNGRKRTTLRRSQLQSIARLDNGVAFGSRSFAGKWSTNWGPMTLEQLGTKVKGTYGYGKQAMRGTAEDNEASLEYDGGKVTLELTEDGALLTGRYSSSNGRKGFWGGYRIRPEVAAAKPGEITSGQTRSWLNYHLRVPKGYDKSKRYPAIAFLHGSNMTARSYVDTIASVWPDIAKRYILVGFDGENLSPSAKAGRRAYNYSYVNFSGPEVGNESVYRQSPALVAEALDELKSELPITHWFLGGHSQGGFLTYAVYMFYPDKVAGVFPMSCNLLVQCEPDYGYFDKPELRRQQRKIAIAVIHGENDNVVPFSSGEYCHRRMIDGGFPTVHLFRHPTAAHMFARLPVDNAIAWLEALTSNDAKTLVGFAKDRLAAKDYRSATAALLRLADIGVPRDLASDADSVRSQIDRQAKPEAAKLTKAIRKNRDNRWVDGFLDFRDKFAFADAAAPAMAAYAKLRKSHAKPADEVFYAARRLRDKAAREAKYREIVEKYYASKWYALVKGWLAK